MAMGMVIDYGMPTIDENGNLDYSFAFEVPHKVEVIEVPNCGMFMQAHNMSDNDWEAHSNYIASFYKIV